MRPIVLILLAALSSGCGGVQSMLDPAGPVAEAIAGTWWAMFWGALLVLALVMALALWTLKQRPRSGPSGSGLIVGGGIVLPAVSLTALLIYGFQTELPQDDTNGLPPLTIEVIGHRWWWEVRYPGGAVTANEIHIPVGRTVRFTLHSADVIHSFWVPQLAGKLDMVPGHANSLELRAERAGAYRGQCAEFCGAQHAHMAFWVIAEPTPKFEAWLALQRQPASAPVGAAAQRGREHFLSVGCAECHTIRGTPAAGTDAPDLTHVGGRRTIAAGTLVNSEEALARWIAHNQRIKPGNLMEPFAHLDPVVLRELAAFLAGLE